MVATGRYLASSGAEHQGYMIEPLTPHQTGLLTYGGRGGYSHSACTAQRTAFDILLAVRKTGLSSPCQQKGAHNAGVLGTHNCGSNIHTKRSPQLFARRAHGVRCAPLGFPSDGLVFFERSSVYGCLHPRPVIVDSVLHESAVSRDAYWRFLCVGGGYCWLTGALDIVLRVGPTQHPRLAERSGAMPHQPHRMPRVPVLSGPSVGD